METPKNQFKQDYVFGLVDKIRLWFLFRKVLRQKINALWEANLDKVFFENNYQDLLNYNEGTDRAALAGERQKPLKEQNDTVIMELENKISHAKAVRGSYIKNENFRAEIITYIEMLRNFGGLTENVDTENQTEISE